MLTECTLNSVPLLNRTLRIRARTGFHPTTLRKMVFGPRGRLSTDLDFTRRTNISVNDLMVMMFEAIEHPYHGISFRFDRDSAARRAAFASFRIIHPP